MWFNANKNIKLKEEILSLASNEISGKKISINVINSMKKGENPKIILSNGKTLILKRVTNLLLNNNSK